MIDTMLALLDEIDHFGVPWHGLLIGANGGEGSEPRLVIGEGEFPVPAQLITNLEGSDTHLVRVPGVAPLDMTPEVLAAEAAEGRVWQDYALLSGDRQCLYGVPLDGWIYIAESGERWLIQPGVSSWSGAPGTPLVLSGTACRFGYLGESPAAPVTLDVMLGDIGQGDGGSGPSILRMRIGSVSPDGRKAVFVLVRPDAPLSLTHSMPAGFLLFELTGSPPVAAMDVLRTREQTLGSVTETEDATSLRGYGIEWSVESVTPRSVEGAGAGPGADVVMVPSGVSQFDLGPVVVGAGTRLAERTGRLAALLFGADGALVEIAVDTRISCDFSYPELQLASTTGSATAWIADNADRNYATGFGQIDLERTASEHLVASIVVRVAGAEAARTQLSAARTITESYRRTRLGNGGAHPLMIVRAGAGFAVKGWDVVRGGGTIDESHSADAGAGVVEWTIPQSELGSHYSSSRLWARDGGEWLCRVSRGALDTDGRPSVDLRLQSLSNNVLRLYTWVRIGNQPGRYRTVALIAPGCTWEQQSPEDAHESVSATYHPATHEIFTDANDPRVLTPFAWI